MVRPFVRAFSELLREYRESAGMTQAKLAEKALLSLRGVNDLERGERKTPRWDTITRLANALGLSAEQRQAFMAAARAARSLPAHGAQSLLPLTINSGVPAIEPVLPSDHDPVAPGAARVVRFPSAPVVTPLRPAQQLPTGAYLGALAETPLVGRDPLRAQLVANLDRAGAGDGGGLVLLGGEPGVGKTRLAQEVTEAAHTRGFLIVSGRCYESQADVAYYPFLEALSMAYGAAPDTLRAALPHRWPELIRLLPDLDVDAGPTSALRFAGGPNEQQQRLFHQVSGFLHALADAWPVALALDDVQWADRASLDLLQYLARFQGAARLMLLGAYRDTEMAPTHPLETLLLDLGREHLVKPVNVRRLSPDGTAALLAVTFGLGSLPADFAQLVHAQADGNPFFTAELLRELVERGAIYQENGQWRTRQQVDLVLPESVRAVIGLRLARLAGATQTALQEASVLGPAFRFDDLREMSALSEEQVEAALDEAEAAVIVREAGQGEYVFHHMLIQQTLYAQLSARRRRRLHRAAGEALERRDARERERRITELANHFAHTDQYERALQYSMQAAQRMRETAARREEAALLGQALAAATHLDDPLLMTELRVSRGEALDAAAMWVDGSRELEVALAELPPGQPERHIAILLELSGASFYAAGFGPQASQRARECAAEALAIAERLGRDDLAARAMSQQAIGDANDGLILESQLRFERAFARAGPNHLAQLFQGLDQYGLNWYYVGDFKAAETYTRQALDLARNAHDPAIITRTLGNLGVALTGSGRYSEALDTFAEARRRGYEFGAWPWLARSISMCAGLHLALDDLAGAEALTEEAREVNRAVRFANVTASTSIDLLITFARRHEAGRADGLLPRARADVAQARGGHSWLTTLRLTQAQAEVALAHGALDEAMRFADDGIAQALRSGRVKYEVLGMQTRAQALAAQGRVKEAITGLHAAVDLARRPNDPALFLRIASSLLAIEGDDALLAEARAAVARITAALSGELRRAFVEGEAVRLIARLSR